MSSLAAPAARLTTGSTALGARLTARAGAWVARGRRTDLTGWRAAFGCWTRLALLTLTLYLTWRIIEHAPNLLWLLTLWWTAAAWRAGKPAPEETPAEAADSPQGEAIRALLLDLMGNAHAVHLSTVLAHLQAHHQWEGRTVSDLRARLEALGIPVDPKVKAPGSRSPKRGVRKADLAPAPTADPETSTAPSTAA